MSDKFYTSIDPMRECPKCGMNNVSQRELSTEYVVDAIRNMTNPNPTIPNSVISTRNFVMMCETNHCWHSWSVALKQ